MVCSQCGKKLDAEYKFCPECGSKVCENGEAEVELVIKKGVLKRCNGDTDTVTAIVVPDGVTEIGKAALFYCVSLASVTIPASVQKINDRAFWICPSLTEICYGGTMGQWQAVKKADGWRKHCQLSVVHCTDGDAEIPLLEGDGDGVLETCTRNVPSVEIPDGVTGIARSAFSASNLSEWEAKMYGYTAAEIANGIPVGCYSLAAVTIPASVKEIEKYAFDGCAALAEIRYNGTVAQWDVVKKHRKWHRGIAATAVRCADGDAAL